MSDRLNAMLTSYCEWLNLWNKGPLGMPDVPPHEPKQFTDPPYGESTILAEFDSDWYHVVAANVSNGDDGGPATLIAHFDRHTPLAIRYMIHEFDTEVQFIIEGGKFVNTPES